MGVSHTGPVFPGPVFGPTSAGDPEAVAGHRISALLGEGALGRVHLAHTPGGQPVALTVLRRENAGQPGFAARFHHHTQAAAGVPAGPYTVPVLGSGKEGDRYWTAAAYLPAISLREAVAGHGPLPTRTVLRLVAGIVEGLRAVHCAGVVHGDLRPAHVLLTAEGPRLKGYGLAALVADPAAGGGPVFLAPEQAGGKPPLTATDVFALGQTAAYASIGAAPFGAGPAGAVLPRVQQEEPDLNELPGELREIVTRCLIKDPALRPSLDQIAAMCVQAAPAAPRRFHRQPEPWLPAPLLAAVVPATPPTAPPRPGASPAAVTVPGAAPGVLPAPPTPLPGTPPGPPLPPPPAGHPQGGFGRAPQYWPRPPYLHLPSTVRGPRRRRAALAGTAAALAIAVAGGIALVGGFGADAPVRGGGAGGAKPTAPPLSPTGPAPTSSADGGGATGPAEPSLPGVYPGFQLRPGYALSWQGGPPVVRQGTYSGDFGYTQQADAFTTDARRGTLALLGPQVPGTPAECRASAAHVASVPRRSVSGGTRVCVRSGDGTTALLTFRQLTDPGAPQQSATVDIAVWRVGDESAESDQKSTERPSSPANSAQFSTAL
jgi:hypothetical protein